MQKEKLNQQQSTSSASQTSQVKKRLFQIATRPKRLYDNPEILLPSTPAPIARELLFRKGRTRRRILELGCGWGEFLFEWLQLYDEDDYIAFEIKESRIASCLTKTRQIKKKIYLRIIPINFNWFLEEVLPPASFDIIVVNFPDPWPKRRHRKHRLVRPGFSDKAAQLLRPKGLLYLATDYNPYARQMLTLMRQDNRFQSLYPYPNFTNRHPVEIPITRFEEMHLQAGKPLCYQLWQFIE